MSDLIAWFGTPELILILVIALLLFGTRLPKVARSMGQGLTEFKKGVKGVKDDVEQAGDEENSAKPPESLSS